MDRERKTEGRTAEIIPKGGEAVEIFADLSVIRFPNGTFRLLTDRGYVEEIIVNHLDAREPMSRALTPKIIPRVKITVEKYYGEP